MAGRNRSPFFAVLLALSSLVACSQGGTAPEAELAPMGAELSWQRRSAAPSTLFEAQGAVSGGKLYVFGGFYNSKIQATKNSYVYDPARNGWRRVADMPEKITHAGVAVVGSTVWFAGGFIGDHYGTSTNHVWRYHTDLNRWSKGPPLPAPRGAGVLVRRGNAFHFLGGVVSRNGRYLDDKGDHWVLEFGTGRWRRLAPLPNQRNHLGGAVLNGKIYAIGGQHLKGEWWRNQKAVHRYDPKTNRWQRVASLPRPTGHIGASTVVHGGSIFVVGGVTRGRKDLANILRYDPKQNRWIEFSKLPKPRSSPVAGVVGRDLIVTTGRNVKLNIHDDTWRGRLP